MGIRGLTAFLKQGSLSSISDHVDMSENAANPCVKYGSADATRAPRNHLIIIDGNAFSHWFCLECLGTAPSLNTNYNILKHHVTSWIHKCSRSKVDLIFIFDGATEPDKLQCRLDRLCKQSAHMNFALSQNPIRRSTNVALTSEVTPVSECQLSSSSSSSSSVKLQSTPPLLAISCIISAIADMKLHKPSVRAFYAKGEADKTIARVAVALKATAIMSNDSDMLIYDTASVGFIPFWAFGFADDGSLNAFVIRRRKVASLMGIKEDSLPFLAAIVGNDFTSAETCYNIHRMLFEGSSCKTDKAKCKLEEILKLDNLDLSPSDIDNSSEIGVGKRRKTCPDPKVKRSDSNLSSSERLKSRRRANKLEEQHKRKVNHLQRSTSEVPLPPESQSDNQLDEGECCVSTALPHPESVTELRSSLEKARCPYGESGIRTVRAAAAFLKKVERHCNLPDVSMKATSASVTAALLCITEAEVMSVMSLIGSISHDTGDSLDRRTKHADLILSIMATFEDSLQRYRLSSTALTPAATATAPADQRESVSMTSSAVVTPPALNLDVSLPVLHDADYIPELRCCFRCYCCSPRCLKIYGESLSDLLTPTALVSRLSTTALSNSPSSQTTSQPSIDLNSISRHSIPSKRDSIGRGIFPLSPDMDQVLRYKMYIGRTPCSLTSSVSMTNARTSVHLQLLSSDSSSSSSSSSGSSGGSDSAVDGIDPIGRACDTDTDYMLLQPLRQKIYAELFCRPSTPSSSSFSSVVVDNVMIEEIFKKNASPYLERRYVRIGPRPSDLKPVPTVTATVTGSSQTDIHSLSGVRPADKRSTLMETAASLVIKQSTVKLFELLHSKSSPLCTLSSVLVEEFASRCTKERVENQYFIMLLTAGLYVSISSTHFSSPGAKKKAIMGTMDSARTAVFISAAAFLISCTYALILSVTDTDTDTDAAVISATTSDTGVSHHDAQCSGEKVEVIYEGLKQHEHDRLDTENPEASKYDMNQADGLDLPLINTWTRLQLCLQHTNYSMEVAARKISIISSLNEKLIQQQEHEEHVQHHGCPAELQSDQLQHDQVNSVYAKTPSASERESKFLELAAGGDLGLLDSTLFFSARLQLEQIVFSSSIACIDTFLNGQMTHAKMDASAILSAAAKNVLLSISANRKRLPQNQIDTAVALLEAAIGTTLCFGNSY